MYNPPKSCVTLLNTADLPEGHFLITSIDPLYVKLLDDYEHLLVLEGNHQKRNSLKLFPAQVQAFCFVNQ